MDRLNTTTPTASDTTVPQLSADDLRFARRQKYTQTHFARQAREAREIEDLAQARDVALKASMDEREQAARASKAQIQAAQDKIVKEYVRERKTRTAGDYRDYRDISAETHLAAYKYVKPAAAPAYIEPNKAHFAALHNGHRLSTEPDETARIRAEQDAAYQAMLTDERRAERERAEQLHAQRIADKQAVCEQLLCKLRRYQKYQPKVAEIIPLLEQMQRDNSPGILCPSEVIAVLETMPRCVEEYKAFMSFVVTC